MLQQTQVATVLAYYGRFLGAFPDVRALAEAPEDRVLEHWSGLGYYRRAHHLHAAAKTIVATHAGAFPRDLETLATLPGVGRTTAAAIAAFAYGAKAAILDGNVKRVLARHRGIEGYPGAPKVEKELWRVAESLLPAENIERYTQALMDLGATVCTRGAPRCDACPVARDCVAHGTNRIAALPSPRPKKDTPQRAVRVLVIERAGTILFEKRPLLGRHSGEVEEDLVEVRGHEEVDSRRLPAELDMHGLNAILPIQTDDRSASKTRGIVLATPKE